MRESDPESLVFLDCINEREWRRPLQVPLPWEVPLPVPVEMFQTIDRFAHMRNDQKEAGGVVDEGVDESMSPLEKNLSGLLGEVPLADYLGIPFDTATGLQGDGGIVDLIYGGRTLQVKFNGYYFGDLYFRKEKPFSADVGILVTSGRDRATVVVKGWMFREKFCELSAPKVYGKHASKPVDAVDQHRLRPIQHLPWELGIT